MLNYEFPPVGGGAGNANYYLLKEFAKNKDLRIDLITCSEEFVLTEYAIINFLKSLVKLLTN